MQFLQVVFWIGPSDFEEGVLGNLVIKNPADQNKIHNLVHERATKF